MKGIVFALVAFVALTQATRDLSEVVPLDITPPFLSLPSGPRIVGGQEATPNSFPYQAALFIELGQRTAFCGGSIISDEYILTAAHCVDKTKKVEVVLGAHKINEDESTQQRIVATEFIVHRGWSPLFLTADIALIKLSQKIVWSDQVQPVRLPKYSDINKNLVKSPATVSGWGKDSDKATTVSPVLRYVDSKVISELICKIYYFGVPGKNHVCINGNGGKGACSGDSGGPLVIKAKDGEPIQHGIVSFGIAFGCEIGFPSVFTRVSSYLKWIHENTGIVIED